MNYLNDLEINDANLQEEVIKQPVLNMRYHELYSEKLEELNEKKRLITIRKAELQEVYASLYIENKNNADKITEKTNDSIILTNEKYKKKQKELFDEIKEQNKLEKNVSVLEGVVKSFHMRQKDLEKAIDLFIFGYHGNVKNSDIKNKILNKLNNKGL